MLLDELCVADHEPILWNCTYKMVSGRLNIPLLAFLMMGAIEFRVVADNEHPSAATKSFTPLPSAVRLLLVGFWSLCNAMQCACNKVSRLD